MKLRMILGECGVHIDDADAPYDWGATLRARKVAELLPEARRELATGHRSPRKGFCMNKARQIARAERDAA